MIQPNTAIDLSSFEEQDIRAIEIEAQRHGVSFDDACLRMLLEHSRQLQKRARLNPIARLFRFQSVN